ncbi:glycerol uptake facilitator protein [Chitinophaga sp. YR573]|uniref:MIP/aquaporin family protein n=1 Tax=Chitinophaga sp. YR573 TaxID=1881040 RepID=UPI0008B73BD6|nr:MIP/aquaporin family protein [Chitinophaga sp. YR573]SEW39218.1 glycerol uptake facilitator protein [Chitinophaga sp. YR573]
MTPFIAEIIGTAVMILLGNGVVANVVLKDTKGNNGGWIVITTAWAFAVFVGVLIAGPYSGAHLNPAVTLSLAIAGKFPWADVPTYIAGEFIGAMTGAFFVWVFYKDHFDRTEDGGAKMAAFCTAPAIRNLTNNFISEVIGTFVLIISIFYITGAEITGNHQPVGLGSIGALPVSIVVWVIGLALGGTTGYAINPARDLGPRIIHAILPIKQKAGSDWGYAWIPVVAPVVGASLAAVVYLFLLK